MSARYWPLGEGRVVTSGFGPRDGEFHWGSDFGRAGGSGGMPVYAAQSGTVVMCGPASGFGFWVVLDHPDEAGGGTTVYGHVVPEVSVGQRVDAGERIARINPDPNSNGGVPPHLHFEVHRYVWVPPGPDRLDPLPWLAAAAEPATGGENMPADIPTVFGIDVSNNNGPVDFAAAAAEGFAFATHKITEGDFFGDSFWPRARDEMARHFPNRWGGYVFCRVACHPDAEADLVLAHSGGTDFPLQIDYEDDQTPGSIEDLLARVNALQARGFRLLPIYLPRWYWRSHMGAPDLSELPVGIWNSDYVTGVDYASALYPGDGDSGWAPMGGKPVEILQFSETAIVAGQRIDANAIRGGAAKLAEIFGDRTGGFLMALDDNEQRELLDNLRYIRGQLGPWPQLGHNEKGEPLTLVDAVAELRKEVGK
ncbi:peptidoglycan DD-metalloendopeptidase family protein [Nocardia sp. CA-145437]|uniref:peptidoglycan DD-metalloendopeptidase family protein n=1 Tax=Nocardia sp. CA-145437 TaxID=3239980 RepID=UPI003D98F324